MTLIDNRAPFCPDALISSLKIRNSRPSTIRGRPPFEGTGCCRNPTVTVGSTKTAVDRCDTVAAAIKGAAKGFEFKTHEKTEDESHGILDTLNKTISVRADLSKEDALRVLVQQVAAANVLMRDRRHFQGISPADMANINTVEASAIAHTVCKRLNLNAPALTAPDFEGMSDSNISRFAENVGVIRSVSQRMINSAEGAVAKELYEEAQAAAEKEKPQPEITDAKPKEKKTVRQPKQMQRTKSEVAMG